MPEAHLKPCYMLEQPKTQGATQATILEDEEKSEMADQQVTQIEIGWLAGIIDGEGYIGITMYRNRTKALTKSVKVELHVTNTDKEIVDKYADILRRLGVNPYIRESANGGGNKKRVWIVGLHRLSPMLKVLRIIDPYLTGAKKIRSGLIKEFLESRVEKIELFRGRSILYTDREIEIINECLSLQKRGTSETIRKAELLAHQKSTGMTIEKQCENARRLMTLHEEGKTNRQIAHELGLSSNSSSKIGWWIRRLKANQSPIQILGYFPHISDDIVRPSVKA